MFPWRSKRSTDGTDFIGRFPDWEREARRRNREQTRSGRRKGELWNATAPTPESTHEDPSTPRHHKRRPVPKSITVSAWEFGSHNNPVLWLLPGAMLDERMYRVVGRALAKLGFYVLVSVQPGTAHATNDLDVSDPAKAAEMNWNAIDALVGDDKPVTIVGHSRGGIIALHMLLQRPDRVRLAVPVKTPGRHVKVVDGKETQVVPSLLPLAWHLVSEMHQRSGFSIAMAHTGDIVPNFTTNVRGMWKQLMATIEADTTVVARECREAGLSDRIVGIWARDDGLAPLATGKKIAEAYGGEPYVVSGKHATALANPAELLEIIQTAIDAADKQLGIDERGVG